MLCGGNTVIMCGTCDMGRNNFFCRTHFFSYPLPLGGVTPEKKYPTQYQKFLLPPPLHGGGVLLSSGTRPPPPLPCPLGPLSYQGSIATGHTYGGAKGA